jgi:transposase
MSGPNKSRRVFDKAFKFNAVRMVLDQGMSQEEVALKLDIGRTALYKWVKQYKTSPAVAFPGKGVRPPGQEAEINCLRRELKEAQDERDILKKALLIFSRPKSDGSPL